MKTKISAPAGMYGLAVEPWSKGEIYAVAADWAQASSPVYVYGEDGWVLQCHGMQVADIRHSPRAALKLEIREAIEQSGEEPDDSDDIEDILSDAIEIDDD